MAGEPERIVTIEAVERREDDVWITGTVEGLGDWVPAQAPDDPPAWVLRRYRAHAWWSHLEKLPSDEDRRAYMAGEILAAASPDLPAVPVALTGDVPLAVPEHWALPEAGLPVAPAPAESAGDAGAAT